jgi:hypothetical protein
MTSERYSIEIYENTVYIYGYLSIREMFDHLNYFDREGYCYVIPGDQNSAMALSKIDFTKKPNLTEELPNNSKEKNILDSLNEDAYKNSKNLKETITRLYSLLEFITDCAEEGKINGMAETDKI